MFCLRNQDITDAKAFFYLFFMSNSGYFILKYLEYLDHMNELLFKLTFTKMDFED